MQKTLKEMLYDLQCFTILSIDLCKTKGNGFSTPRWTIKWIQTVGGEKFKFAQPDVWGNEGSGIYFDTIPEAETYAKECVRNLFKSAERAKFAGFDANDYDWHPRGNLAEL